MMLKLAAGVLLWMLLALAALLTACVASLPPSPPVQPPAIPPLPMHARQVLSPSHSASASADTLMWHRLLMTPSTAAAPASVPTTR